MGIGARSHVFQVRLSPDRSGQSCHMDFLPCGPDVMPIGACETVCVWIFPECVWWCPGQAGRQGEGASAQTCLKEGGAPWEQPVALGDVMGEGGGELPGHVGWWQPQPALASAHQLPCPPGWTGPCPVGYEQKETPWASPR